MVECPSSGLNVPLHDHKTNKHSEDFSSLIQGFFICHIINYTGYNQKSNVGIQITSVSLHVYIYYNLG